MKTLTLQNVLRINAASSAATGILLVALPGQVQEIFSAAVSWPFTETGLFLIGFAAIAFFISRSNPIQNGGMRVVIALDSAWVIASVLMLVVQPLAISVIGNLMIAGVALWVTAMIYLQFTAWKEYAPSK